MIRRISIAGIVAAGLLAPLSASAPATAGSGLGCAGNDCSILLSKLITLNGDVGTGVVFSSFFAWLTDAGTPNGVSGVGFGNCWTM
jgi:hypothetical protein